MRTAIGRPAAVFTAAVAITVTMTLIPAGLTAASAAPVAAAPVAAAPAVAAEAGWAKAQQVPGTATLNKLDAAVESVACSSPGNCSAGGSYQNSANDYQAFLVNEVNGVWGTAAEVPGSAVLNTGGDASVESVSCPSAGGCSAAGTYEEAANTFHAFVVDEVNGAWGSAQEVPGSAALDADGGGTIQSISCASAGNCSAGGSYADSSGDFQALVASEVNGVWGDAEEVPGSGPLNESGNADVLAVSCASAGNCSAGGYVGTGTGQYQAFVTDEVNGTWSGAQLLPGSATLNAGNYARVDTMSCTPGGNCAAGGYYLDGQGDSQAFVASEVNGTWDPVTEVPGTGALNVSGNAAVTSVSCTAAGDCLAGGSYADKADHVQAFVASETGGSWGKAKEIPGTGSLNAGEAATDSVSCASAGNCAAGGSYGTAAGGQEAFVATELKGVWGTAIEVPGTSSLNADSYAGVAALSCTRAGNCSAGGYYTDKNGQEQAFVITESKSSTVLSASAATLVFGHEAAEHLAVAVTPDYAAGKVNVTADLASGRESAWSCQITLKASAGSCGPAATRLGAGTYHLVAAYGGSTTLPASASAAKTVIVTPAGTTARLSLSAAAVTQPKEAAERFTVQVSPRYAGEPAGTVVITAARAKRTVRVCELTLKAGRGSCALPAKKLAAGTYRVSASYQGDNDFRRSVTAAKTLMISK